MPSDLQEKSHPPEGQSHCQTIEDKALAIRKGRRVRKDQGPAQLCSGTEKGPVAQGGLQGSGRCYLVDRSMPKST